MRSSSSKRDAGWYGIAALVSGTCAVGLWVFSRIIGTYSAFSYFLKGMPKHWSNTFLSVTSIVLIFIAFAAVVPAIVFAIKGKKRLTLYSKPHDSLNLNVGLILGILSSVVVGLTVLAILVAAIVTPWEKKTGTTSSTSEWKTRSFTDTVSIKYREVQIDKNTSLGDVVMISPESGWVVGSDGQILRYSDGKWRGMTGEPKYMDVQSVSTVDENDVWFAGIEELDAKNMRKFKFWILHYDGIKMSTVGSWDVDNNDNVAIAMAGKNDGWAGGSSGMLLHYDGQKWDPVAANGNTQVRCLVFENASKGWQVGKDLYSYAHGQWIPEGFQIDYNYDKILPMNDGSVLLAADYIFSDEREGKTRQLNTLARVEKSHMRQIAGFEQRLIHGMARGPDGYAVLVGKEFDADRGVVMLYQNGRKVGGDISLPEYVTPEGISFDSQNHGWISTDEANMIEFKLLIAE